MEIIPTDIQSLLFRIAVALEQIADNTKSQDLKEREYRVTGFSKETP